MMHRLSVIIPVHGEITPVLRLLASIVGPDVAAEDRPAQVIIVDDASPAPLDESVLPDGVQLIRREHNGGFGAAVNSGLAQTTAEFAAVLNSDLSLPPRFLPDFLSHALPVQPAIVGCRSESEDGTSGYAARYFPTISHQVIEWLVPLASLRHHDALHRAVGHDLAAERGSGLVPVDWVSGAVLLLPVEQVRQLGGFDEGYFMYTEEVDLQLRCAEQGIPRYLDADLTVIHAGGGSSGNEARRRKWLVGARMRYARKHGNVHLLRAGMTAASTANLVWNVGRRLVGRDVRPVQVAREELALIHHAGKDLPR